MKKIIGRIGGIDAIMTVIPIRLFVARVTSRINRFPLIFDSSIELPHVYESDNKDQNHSQRQVSPSQARQIDKPI